MTNAGGIQMVDATRATFRDGISVKDIRELAEEPRLRVIQCGEPVRDEVWTLINEHFCPVCSDGFCREISDASSEISCIKGR